MRKAYSTTSYNVLFHLLLDTTALALTFSLSVAGMADVCRVAPGDVRKGSLMQVYYWPQWRVNAQSTYSAQGAHIPAPGHNLRTSASCTPHVVRQWSCQGSYATAVISSARSTDAGNHITWNMPTSVVATASEVMHIGPCVGAVVLIEVCVITKSCVDEFIQRMMARA